MVFNGLNLKIQNLLTSANYYVGVINKYFDLNSDFTKQEIREILHGYYSDALNEEFSKDKNLVFLQILQRIVPKDFTKFQLEALVIMSYFFESCDILESPNDEE
jgi:hypothetical protein